MKRELINRAKEICNELIDLEASLKELNDVEEELNKILDDDCCPKFYFTFHTSVQNMLGFSKHNPYILELIYFERKGIEFQIYELTKELETL